MKIIIIEDEGITRQWLKKKLEELSVDYHVEGVFSNGRQALDFLITAGDVDVVFTDIRMPVMDGMEFLEKLQETGLEPYKVILSAYDEFQYARGAMRLGAQEFVLKPEITKEALQQILSDAANYLGQKKREKEEKRTKGVDRERGAAFAELIKQDLTDMDELAAVLGQNVTKQDVSRLVIVDIYLEKQALQESVGELLDLFLAQEGLCGVWFWSGSQRILLGYLHNTQAQRLVLMERLGEILRVHTGIKPYIGISRIQREGKIKEMYRQAVAARENRFFFGLCGPQQYDDMRISMNQDPGELYFNQDIKEIVGCLQQADYGAAVQRVDIFLEKVKKASYLHPAYVKALCDEILSVCRYSLWDYALNEEEKEFLEETAQLMLKFPTIPCNDCKYCMPCPYGLDIPAILVHYNKCVNEGNVPKSSQDENYRRARRAFLIGYDRSVPKLRQASHCTGCNQCNPHCPQSIDIPKELHRIDAYVEQLKQETL